MRMRTIRWRRRTVVGALIGGGFVFLCGLAFVSDGVAPQNNAAAQSNLSPARGNEIDVADDRRNEHIRNALNRKTQLNHNEGLNSQLNARKFDDPPPPPTTPKADMVEERKFVMDHIKNDAHSQQKLDDIPNNNDAEKHQNEFNNVDNNVQSQSLRQQVPTGNDRFANLSISRKDYPVLRNGKFIAGNRIVHFDLKGAAPKPEYLVQLFKLSKSLGATGVLLEWEDMFPYEGTLKVARHKDAYTKDEIRFILKGARSLKLDIIPLVQTFGHLEWFLKLQQFGKFREVERYPQVICIGDDVAVNLVKEMVKEVIDLHKEFEMPYFHIGADEAFQVGMCAADQELMEKELSGSRERLMLRHIAGVAKYVIHLAPSTRPLMWHDMLNNVDAHMLEQYSFGQLLEPVVWNYAENLDDQLWPDMWSRFGQTFPFMWAASAFKGADGPSRFYSNVPHYLKNHVSWLTHMTAAYRSFKEFRGIILTGWQRFDHMALLAEMLPVGVPSLAVNLQTITRGGYDQSTTAVCGKLLNCSNSLDIESYGPAASCNFPVFHGLCVDARRLMAEKLTAKQIKFRTNQILENNNIDQYIWRQTNVDVMRGIVFAKFQQNSALRSQLQETGNRIIIEATSDPYWGCGVSFRHRFTRQFTGFNHAGKVMMDVREYLFCNSSKQNHLCVGDSIVRGLDLKETELICMPGCNSRHVFVVATCASLLPYQSVVVHAGTNDFGKPTEFSSLTNGPSVQAVPQPSLPPATSFVQTVPSSLTHGPSVRTVPQTSLPPSTSFVQPVPSSLTHGRSVRTVPQTSLPPSTSFVQTEPSSLTHGPSVRTVPRQPLLPLPDTTNKATSCNALSVSNSTMTRERRVLSRTRRPEQKATRAERRFNVKGISGKLIAKNILRRVTMLADNNRDKSVFFSEILRKPCDELIFARKNNLEICNSEIRSAFSCNKESLRASLIQHDFHLNDFGMDGLHLNMHGAAVYEAAQRLRMAITNIEQNIDNDYQVHGWLSRYNIKHNISNAWYLDQINDKIQMALHELKSIVTVLKQEMPLVFRSGDTTDEFIYEYVEPHLLRMQEMDDAIRRIGGQKNFANSNFV